MCSFSVCLLGWVIIDARTVNGVCMNGLAVVEALLRRTGITGNFEHTMGASYEEISFKLQAQCNVPDQQW